MTLYADVIFPLPIDQAFAYLVPPLWAEMAKVGSRVLAPFGGKTLTGFIIGLKTEPPGEALKLKEIEEVLDQVPAFGEKFLAFSKSLSEHYYSSWGEILQSSLPPSLILKTQTRFALSEGGADALQKGKLSGDEESLASLLAGKAYSFRYLKKKSGIKNISSLISRMRRKDLLQIREDLKRGKKRKEIRLRPAPRQLEFDLWPGSLEEQAIQEISASFGRQASSPFFLVGPDRCREMVYFGLIRRVLAQPGQTLFLVPDISLGTALSREFFKKFGERVAILHSQLTPKSREREWQRIRSGEVDVVVGPRSALFSPLSDLRLIIVDREHDDSYFQTENPSFDVRRGAWMRAMVEKAVCVYGSGRPSVEGYYRARAGGYNLSLESPKKRARVTIIDDRRERDLVCRHLKSLIASRLKQKGPALLFFNRRGYSSSLFCPRCDYTPRCDRCDISLAYHKREERLVCHYCNFSIPFAQACPRCGSRLIKKRGAGIEAVEEELKRAFPGRRVAVFDSDVVKNQDQRDKILRDFQKGKIPILLGTQLLARQFELPPVSLVGILFPETMLALSDYRAGQKTFQAVSGMMDFVLDDPLSEVVIQTAAPDHFALAAAATGDYQSFFDQEIKFRQLMNYPPFSHVAEVLFQGEDLRNLGRKMRELFPRWKSLGKGVDILGPALASVSRVRGLSRVQVILKAERREALDQILRWVKSQFRGKKSILVSD